MKPITHFIALASITFTLTACDSATTDEPLPQGDSVGTTVEPTSIDPVDAESSESDYVASPKYPQPGVKPSAESAELQYSDIAQAIESPINSDRITQPGISFATPDGWSMAGPKPMRLFTLVPPAEHAGSDLAVNKWPSRVGGFALNINRWAGQAGRKAPSLKRTDYPQIDVGGIASTWVEFAGDTATNGILAIWVPMGDDPDAEGPTWTFKLTGPPDKVKALAPTVKDWLKTVKFE